jgi:hypothetical protein
VGYEEKIQVQGLLLGLDWLIATSQTPTPLTCNTSRWLTESSLLLRAWKS